MFSTDQLGSKLVALFSAFFVVTMLSGCAHMGDLYQPPGKTPLETVPFSITFDLQGNPLVLTPEGERIKPERVDFPIREVKAIGNIKTISAVEVHGSHYYVLNIGDDFYVIDLPPPHP